MRILLIDNDQQHLEHMQGLLGGTDRVAPFQFATAATMERAVSVLQEEQVDLIGFGLGPQFDVPLPAVQQLVNHPKAAPVVVVMEQEDDHLACQLIMSGAQDCLVKSQFTAGQLSRAMRFAVARHAFLSINNEIGRVSVGLSQIAAQLGEIDIHYRELMSMVVELNGVLTREEIHRADAT